MPPECRGSTTETEARGHKSTIGHQQRDSVDETQPLLQNGHIDDNEDADDRELLTFERDDKQNPRNWPYRIKMLNVATIASMAILSALASNMFTPGIDQIAQGLNTTTNSVIACSIGFVVMLGIGPLLHAPLSETFGRYSASAMRRGRFFDLS